MGELRRAECQWIIRNEKLKFFHNWFQLEQIIAVILVFFEYYIKFTCEANEMHKIIQSAIFCCMFAQ